MGEGAKDTERGCEVTQKGILWYEGTGSVQTERNAQALWCCGDVNIDRGCTGIGERVRVRVYRHREWMCSECKHI